jgi:hypothetical protein
MSPPNPPTSAPTAPELLADPMVQLALDQAWAASQPTDPNARHEEGGWIYIDLSTGQLTIRRAPAVAQAGIDLSNPPTVAGAVVVGKFHTHPQPVAEGWNPGPSASDLYYDTLHGVPDLIKAEDGIHLSGPDSRRKGLAGGPGFPPP